MVARFAPLAVARDFDRHMGDISGDGALAPGQTSRVRERPSRPLRGASRGGWRVTEVVDAGGGQSKIDNLFRKRGIRVTFLLFAGFSAVRRAVSSEQKGCTWAIGPAA